MESTWFITGASRGIGRLATQVLLERGHRVAATLRDPSRLDDLLRRHPGQLSVHRLDVRDASSIAPCALKAMRAHGRIDVVFSNAGYGLFGTAEELGDEQIADQIATNLLGPIHLARAFLPHLREQGRGHFVQMSSMGGLVAVPGLSMYHVTKWGTEAFFESVGGEVGNFGVAVTLVEPGVIRNDFHKSIVRGVEKPQYTNNPALLSLTREEIPLEQMIVDPLKVVEAIISVTELPDPPRRLILGSDAYRWIHAALTERLKAVEAQRDTAAQADITQ